MFKKYRDTIRFALHMVIGVGLLFFGLLTGVNSIVEYSCSKHTEITGQPTKTAAMSCYVQADGKWMHWDEYKLRFATHGTK